MISTLNVVARLNPTTSTKSKIDQVVQPSDVTQYGPSKANVSGQHISRPHFSTPKIMLVTSHSFQRYGCACHSAIVFNDELSIFKMNGV